MKTDNTFVHPALIAGICLVIVIIVVSISLIWQSKDKITELTQKIDELRKVISLEADFADAYDSASKGNTYYDLSNMAYENYEFMQSESNCKIARDYFSEYTQKIVKLKVEVEEEKSPIFKDYQLLFESSIRLYNSLYEACEYMESTSRHFNKYYINGDDYEYDAGLNELEMMNEKIRLHDSEVLVYNSLYEKVNKQLKEL